MIFMITYKQDGSKVTVLLEGRVIGRIEKSDEGYCYFPKGTKKYKVPLGETFPTLEECKSSLEED